MLRGGQAFSAILVFSGWMRSTSIWRKTSLLTSTYIKGCKHPRGCLTIYLGVNGPIWHLTLTTTFALLRTKNLMKTQLGCSKMVLAETQVFKIPCLSPLPWEVAIPFYRCVNRGSMGARESSNIPDILWTLGNGGAGLFVLLCHGSVSTVMAAPALICSLKKFAKSH